MMDDDAVLRRWFVVIMLTALAHAAACGHTSIRNESDDCGEFESESLGPLFSSADEYARYQSACATARFATTVAAQRIAVVEAAKRVAEQADARRKTELAAADTARHAPELLAEELTAGLGRQRGGRLLIHTTVCAADEGDCASIRGRIETALVQLGAFTILDYTGLGRIPTTVEVSVRAATNLGRSVGATHVLLIEMRRSRTSVALNINARLVSVTDAAVIASANRTFEP